MPVDVGGFRLWINVVPEVQGFLSSDPSSSTAGISGAGHELTRRPHLFHRVHFMPSLGAAASVKSWCDVSKRNHKRVRQSEKYPDNRSRDGAGFATRGIANRDGDNDHNLSRSHDPPEYNSTSAANASTYVDSVRHNRVLSYLARRGPQT